LLKEAKTINNPVVWSIPIGIPKRVVFENILFVGDSARQVKPFSGGGLLTGFIAADELSKALLTALNGPKKIFQLSLLSYENSIRKNFIRSLEEN